jgi:hypothetical protein
VSDQWKLQKCPSTYPSLRQYTSLLRGQTGLIVPPELGKHHWTTSPGHASPFSQGGDTGSNPVGTAQRSCHIREPPDRLHRDGDTRGNSSSGPRSVAVELRRHCYLAGERMSCSSDTGQRSLTQMIPLSPGSAGCQVHRASTTQQPSLSEYFEASSDAPRAQFGQACYEKFGAEPTTLLKWPIFRPGLTSAFP